MADITSLKQEYSELMQKAKNIQEQIKNFNKKNTKVYFRLLDNYDHWYNDMAASTLNGTIGIMYDKKKQIIANRNWGYNFRVFTNGYYKEVLEYNYRDRVITTNIYAADECRGRNVESPRGLFHPFSEEGYNFKTSLAMYSSYLPLLYRPLINYKE